MLIANTYILGIKKQVFRPMVGGHMSVWGATPEPPKYYLALSIENTSIPGIQKHLFWPMVYRHMGVWGATPEPEQYFFGIVHF